MRLWRRRPVQIEVTNGLGFPVEQVTLIPGQTAKLYANLVLNVCDRGFPSKDGVHRLTTKTIEFPVQIRLRETP